MKIVDNNEEITSDTFTQWREEFKHDHPIAYWIDDKLKDVIRHYAPHYVLTHPWVLINDAFYQLRWAYQRVVRGWDDRASWSIDYWLDEMMPNILLRLKNASGTPLEFLDNFTADENQRYSPEQEAEAKKLWNIQLDKMINGFITSKKMNDMEWKDMDDYKILEMEFKQGMDSFIKYYHNLWD